MYVQFFIGTYHPNQSWLINTSHCCQCSKILNIITAPQSNEQVPIWEPKCCTSSNKYLFKNYRKLSICIMYILPRMKKKNFKKETSRIPKIHTNNSSMQSNLRIGAWNPSRVRQCVVRQERHHEERTFERTRWRTRNVNVVYRS